MDNPNEQEAAEETVPKSLYETVRDHANFLSEENKRLRERPAAYLLGEMLAKGAEVAVDVIAEWQKWRGWKR